MGITKKLLTILIITSSLVQMPAPGYALRPMATARGDLLESALTSFKSNPKTAATGSGGVPAPPSAEDDIDSPSDRQVSMSHEPLRQLDRDYPYKILVIGPFVDKLGEDTVLFGIIIRRLLATFPNAKIKLFMDYPELFEMDESLRGSVEIVSSGVLRDNHISRRQAKTKPLILYEAVLDVIKRNKSDIVIDLLLESQLHGSSYIHSNDMLDEGGYPHGRRPYLFSGFAATGIASGMVTPQLNIYDRNGDVHHVGSPREGNVYDNIEASCDLFGMSKVSDYTVAISEQDKERGRQFLKIALEKKGIRYDSSYPVIWLSPWAISSFPETEDLLEGWQELLRRLNDVRGAYAILSLGGRGDYERMVDYSAGEAISRMELSKALIVASHARNNIVVMEPVRGDDYSAESMNLLHSLLAVSDIVITSDSGPLHAAHFMGKPIVVIGRRESGAWRPPSAAAKYMYNTTGPYDARRRHAAFTRVLKELMGLAIRWQWWGFFDYLPEPAFVYDFDGNIVYANNSAVENYGYSHFELVRMNISRLRHNAFVSGADIIPQNRQRPRPMATRGEYFTRDGRPMTADVTTSISRSGGRSYVVAITHIMLPPSSQTASGTTALSASQHLAERAVLFAA